jgi:hypothetical protein
MEDGPTPLVVATLSSSALVHRPRGLGLRCGSGSTGGRCSPGSTQLWSPRYVIFKSSGSSSERCTCLVALQP